MIISSIRKLYRILVSRHLFRNWLSAGFRYFLVRRGLAKGFITVRCGNSVYRLSPSLYLRIIDAYSNGYITEVSCANSMELILSSTIKLVISKDGDALFVMPDGIRLEAESISLTILFETWLYDVHFLGFDLSNWLVVDVGAFVGDTALYYAKRGAFVIAIEPVPSHFETMLKNLELNPGLKPRILPINAAIADKDEYVEIAVDGEFDSDASMYKSGIKRVRATAYTLRSLLNYVKGLGIVIDAFRTKALKMDCKGCEWDVVNNELDTLKIFDIIKIEYSAYLRNYSVDQLISRIETAGYKCRKYAHNAIAVKMGLNKHGSITCMRP